MPTLHVRLFGNQKSIFLPASLKNANLKLRSYRIVFNRNDHGYYFARLSISGTNINNLLSYPLNEPSGTGFDTSIPLPLNPEAKQTLEHCRWDLGNLQNVQSAITFSINFENGIQRKWYKDAVFDTNDPNVLTMGVSKDFANKIPFYIPKVTELYDTTYDAQDPTATYETGDINDNQNRYHTQNRPKTILSRNFNSDGTTSSSEYNTANQFKVVHTGLNITDPQPGLSDWTNDPTTEEERARCQAFKNANGGNSATWGSLYGGKLPYACSGLGFRTGPVIYPFSIDLYFEISKATEQALDMQGR